MRGEGKNTSLLTIFIILFFEIYFKNVRFFISFYLQT